MSRALTPDQEREAARRVQAGEPVRKVAAALGVSHQTAANISARNLGATSHEETQEQIEVLQTLIGALLDRAPGANDRDLPAISGRVAKLQAEVRQLRMATRANDGEPDTRKARAATIRARIERIAASGVPVEPVKTEETTPEEAADGTVPR